MGQKVGKMTEEAKVKAGAESRAETPDEQFTRWLAGLQPEQRAEAVRKAEKSIRQSEHIGRAPVCARYIGIDGVWFGYTVAIVGHTDNGFRVKVLAGPSREIGKEYSTRLTDRAWRKAG